MSRPAARRARAPEPIAIDVWVHGIPATFVAWRIARDVWSVRYPAGGSVGIRSASEADVRARVETIAQGWAEKARHNLLSFQRDD